jgi:hypothetical protein
MKRPDDYFYLIEGIKRKNEENKQLVYDLFTEAPINVSNVLDIAKLNEVFKAFGLAENYLVQAQASLLRKKF